MKAKEILNLLKQAHQSGEGWGQDAISERNKRIARNSFIEDHEEIIEKIIKEVFEHGFNSGFGNGKCSSNLSKEGFEELIKQEYKDYKNGNKD